VTAIGERGYRATTVADVIAAAGASRKTFYQQFANKRECFLAAYDMIAAQVTRELEEAYSAADGWPERVQVAISSLFETALENRAALRLATVEIGAAGHDGIVRREASIELYMRFISDAVELAPGEGEISEEIARAVVGGVYRILQGGISQEDLKLVPDLARWASSYYPAPREITTRARRTRQPEPLEGGRAPGTLAPHSSRSERRGLRNYEGSGAFLAHSQRERILDAVANLSAAQRFDRVGVNDIAEEAAVSLSAFYEHFSGKDEALLAAYELGHAKALAFVERAYASKTEWPRAVRAGLRALLRFLAAEPAFAHLALVEALTASSGSAASVQTGVADFGGMLVPGMNETGHAPSAVTIEAIVGGIFELCLHHAVNGRTRELPDLTTAATYIALAPFIGSEEAGRVAVG
jgi:AcrR family transcriptional regulator